MRKKHQSTMISLKMEDELLHRLDEYCEQTGVSRTSMIERAVKERLYQADYNKDPDSLRYLKQEGLWYEWTDGAGNWKIPGKSDLGGMIPVDKKDIPKAIMDIQEQLGNILEVGDSRKIVTCKGVHGIAVLWSFTGIYIDGNGQVHEDIDAYVKEAVLKMRRMCRRGFVFTDMESDGVSDYQICWFVPATHLLHLEYEDILDARKILNKLYQ